MAEIDWKGLVAEALNEIEVELEGRVDPDNVEVKMQLEQLAHQMTIYLQRAANAETEEQRQELKKDFRFLQSTYKLIRTRYEVRKTAAWLDTAIRWSLMALKFAMKAA